MEEKQKDIKQELILIVDDNLLDQDVILKLVESIGFSADAGCRARE